MKNFIFLLFCLGITLSAFAQNLQDYSFVKVPVKYEFLKEENQYQLNALTAFLFEKKGFEVLYREDIPAGIDPCDVLQAEVHSDSGLFRSKLFFTLKNCENEIIFTSETGVSREKDYKDSYHEALREAFSSLDRAALNKKTGSKDVEIVEERAKEVIVDPVVTAEEMEELKPKQDSSAGEKSRAVPLDEKKFSNGPWNYTLKKTSVGFELYRDDMKEKFATLLKSGGGNTYLYASETISGNAFFDSSGNLVVEYLDPNNQQLVSVTYELQVQ